MSAPLAALLTAMHRHFSRANQTGGAVAREAAQVLAAVDQATERPVLAPPPRRHPALDHLGALRAANQDLLEGTFAPLAELLPWRYGYDPRPDAPGLENNMAWAEIIGPAAPIISHQVGFGVTLIGAGTHYLPHRHPAVELYAVVAGTAIWTAGGIESPRPAGSFILHPSNIIHAMRTTTEPMLAIYSWSGDIVTATAWE